MGSYDRRNTSQMIQMVIKIMIKLTQRAIIAWLKRKIAERLWLILDALICPFPQRFLLFGLLINGINVIHEHNYSPQPLDFKWTLIYYEKNQIFSSEILFTIFFDRHIYTRSIFWNCDLKKMALGVKKIAARCININWTFCKRKAICLYGCFISIWWPLWKNIIQTNYLSYRNQNQFKEHRDMLLLKTQHLREILLMRFRKKFTN